MLKPWRLTRQAQASLVDIAGWTAENFGPRQAAAYEEDLIERCTAIAAGTAPSQSCRQLLDRELDENLRFARCGQHFVVFVEKPDAAIVVDVLHARSDLPEKLPALPAPIPNRRQ